LTDIYVGLFNAAIIKALFEELIIHFIIHDQLQIELGVNSNGSRVDLGLYLAIKETLI